jgi:hypothetical protein
MRKLALALVPLLLLGCSREPAAPDAVLAPTFSATSDWNEEVFDLPAGDIKFFAPCVDDWFDEVGPILNRFHLVTTKDGSLFYIKVRQLDGFHIVGDKTGVWNPAVPNQEATYTERIPAGVIGSYSFHYSLIPYIFVSEVNGTKIDWPLLLKVTINPNGEVTVNRDFEPCHILGKQ